MKIINLSLTTIHTIKIKGKQYTITILFEIK